MRRSGNWPDFITRFQEKNVSEASSLMPKDTDQGTQCKSTTIFLIIVKNFLERNRSRGEKSSSDQAKEYLSSLDNKTLTDLIEVYRVDFEMFQYSAEGYNN